MKPQSIVLLMALLTACAPSYGQGVTPGVPQDYQAMMKAVERAQAEANQPGDQQLTCDQLQEQLVVIAQDPAYLAHVKAVGIAAEKDMAQMQVPQSEIAAKTAATIIASTVPGAAMGHMTASAAENQAKVAQGAARMQSRMADGNADDGFHAEADARPAAHRAGYGTEMRMVYGRGRPIDPERIGHLAADDKP